MTDQEPPIRSRRSPRPRLNQTPPLSESQISLQKEKLKSNMEVVRKTDVLLKKAIDEDEITGLRTPETYPRNFFLRISTLNYRETGGQVEKDPSHEKKP